MREILFRGKRIDNCDWVYGQLWVNRTGTRETTYIFLDDGDMEEVEVSTVGQDTGLKDKNDVKIFEGDVVLGISTYKVVFVQGGFFLSDISTPNSNLQLLSDLVSFVAVISNIHDNPEMMGAQNDH